jgi:hypothetical protein
MLRIFTPEKSGFEPAILGTRGQHANHWTTEAATYSAGAVDYLLSPNLYRTVLQGKKFFG